MKWPKNLKILKLSNTSNIKINNLPESLEYIDFGCSYNYPINNIDFSLLTKLHTIIYNIKNNKEDEDEDEDEVIIIPKNIKNLILKYSNLSLNRFNLPESLETIEFSDNFNNNDILKLSFNILLKILIISTLISLVNCVLLETDINLTSVSVNFLISYLARLNQKSFVKVLSILLKHIPQS